jgi:asparaginyl-tRNA synthetase
MRVSQTGSFLPSTIADLFSGDHRELIGREVTISGWVKTCRIQQKGSLLFIEFRDGTTPQHVQVLVFQEDFDEQTFQQLNTLSTGWALEVTGTFVESPAKGQLVELRTSSFKVLGECPTEYVLQKHSSTTKGATLETLRQQPHLRCRAGWAQSVSRVRHELMMATHKYYTDNGFVWATTPLITFSDCEGAGEAFLVKTDYPKAELPNGEFFGKEAYLTVSGQLEGEMMATSLSRIYTFGHTFRAEKSKTSRHLSEFMMIEPEICFIDLEKLIKLACEYVKVCIKSLIESNTEDLKITLETAFQDEPKKKMFELRKQRLDQLQKYIDEPFKVISYTEAIELLQKYQSEGHKFEEHVEWGIDMSSEHEKFLTDTVFQRPVAVHSYPAAIKAFYMKRYSSTVDGGDPRCVQAFDLLVPGIGELIGGSIREHDYGKLHKIMTDKGMDLEAYKPYLDLRVFGTVPHGGFGLGFERLVQFVTGIHHIQDCIPFPRAYN